MTAARAQLAAMRRIVVKIGSSLVTNDGAGLNLEAIAGWAGDVAGLQQRGYELVLVSSGSIAEGVARLGWRRRPHALQELQAAAAVGQMGLIQAYESAFQTHGRRTAQVLLTYEDLSDRRRYLNARSTLQTLLRLGVVPIVNENDTVATEEIRFGDNDTLAGLVANLLAGDLLLILTDQDGLFDADPRTHAQASLVTQARAGDVSLLTMAGAGGAWGRGGMQTKLKAAALAARSGTATVIANGRAPQIIQRIAGGENIGTYLDPGAGRMAARKRWLAGMTASRGELVLDAGAVTVLRERGKSLLAVGVTAVKGDFERGELVICVAPDGREVGRGLVNYSAAETRRIKGLPSDRIEQILGYLYEPELIHRDNLVLSEP
jgi:glutamate 5-kinase